MTARAAATARVLVVTPGHDDFLIDGLVHGLRQLLGSSAVEFPRCDHLYAGHPPERLANLHGKGFVFGGALDADDDVNRDRALYRAAEGEFDLVIFGDIWRTFGHWVQWMPVLSRAGMHTAVIDSSDRIEPFPFAGLFWRVRHWWTLPRVTRKRAVHFKREVTRWSGWFRSYLLLPPPLAPAVRAEPISFGIPASLVVESPPHKTKRFTAHVVDAELAPLVGGQTAYAFDSAGAYRADLERSMFGITTKKAGWDALRHYEIAAAGAVPCFRDLEEKPPRCAPYGLEDGVNCVAHSDAAQLLSKLDGIDAAGYERLQAGALAWARCHTTEDLARRVLASCGVRA